MWLLVPAGVWADPQQHSGGPGAALLGSCAGSGCEHLFNTTIQAGH